MILYNTSVGIAAGLSLILVPVLARRIARRERIAPEGWSLTFGILGTILTVLAGAITLTWPLDVNPPINILFGEPSLFLGVTMLAASIFLWKKRDLLVALSATSKAGDEAHEELGRILRPLSWLVFAIGMILLSCTFAILRFSFVGGAPAAEPITGMLSNHPAVENTFFGIMYGLAAIGCLKAPWAVRNLRGRLARMAGVCLISAGVLFLVFSAMNYYTHIGLLVNIQEGTNYRW